MPATGCASRPSRTAELLGEDPELGIRIDADPAAGTVTITDNGIGMTREEAIANLGTIARSGTARVLPLAARAMSRRPRRSSASSAWASTPPSSSPTGSRCARARPGDAAEAGVRWESGADGEFTVETVTQAARGTSVTLHLKDDAKEFADAFRLRAPDPPLFRPHRLPGAHAQGGRGLASSTKWSTRPRRCGRCRAPRSRRRSTGEFYQYLAHDFTDPLAWSHNKVEGKREYTSLLYLPARAPFDLWQRDAARGLKLYVRRVFIMDDAEQFLPLYLRFVKGVVDSADLPLNVSRELLQQDPEVEAIRGGLTKRVLDLLGAPRQGRAGQVRHLLEGVRRGAEGGRGRRITPTRRRILALLRFASTHAQAHDNPAVSLADYVGAHEAGPGTIYYVIAESVAAARGSPAIERLKERGRRGAAAGRAHRRVGHGAAARVRGQALQGRCARRSGAGRSWDGRQKAADDDPRTMRTGAVRARGQGPGRCRRRGAGQPPPGESPVLPERSEDEMSESMRRILAAAGREDAAGETQLELNMAHPLVQRLEGLRRRGFRRTGAAAVRSGAADEQGQPAESRRIRPAPE